MQEDLEFSISGLLAGARDNATSIAGKADSTMCSDAKLTESSSLTREPMATERKRRRSIADAIPNAEHREVAADGPADHARAGAPQPPQVWRGAVRLGAAAGEFCRAMLQLPRGVKADLLPSVLIATTVKQRRGIRTKGTLACPTLLTGSGPQKHAELRAMAQHELVAIVPLEGGCSAILVPYKGAGGDLRAVTFLARLP